MEEGNKQYSRMWRMHYIEQALVAEENTKEVAFRQSGKVSPSSVSEEDMMWVDSGEDEWARLHDIRLNGPVLEYTGRGKNLTDVGLAQARTALCTRSHYYEIEIVDPGQSCYIAIGLARKDYPKNRHPGWNHGSIAYHADDGKIFVGSGVGGKFGPRCHKGDTMGCGILFPRNYVCKSDSEEEIEQQGGGKAPPSNGARAGAGGGDGGADGGAAGAAEGLLGRFRRNNDFLEDLDDGEDDWGDDSYAMGNGVAVQVYFMRNGKMVGKRGVRIPRGGFYPTIGMMSRNEKVRVDLKPLSG